MAITVGEALTIGGLKRAVLLAGRGGLDRTIQCVDVLEVPDINGSDGWLRANELLVTTCFAVKDNLEGQLNILRAMAKVDSSALAVKFGRFIGKVPPEMCELADALNIPLINIPNDMPFIDVTLPVMTAILNEQSLRLQYSEEVRSKMTKVSLEACGLSSVAKVLAELIAHNVLICNAELQQLAAGGPERSPQYQLFPDEIQKCRQSGICNTVIGLSNGEKRSFASFPIDVRQGRYGYILVDLHEPLTDQHHIAIEHAITLAALQMVKEEALIHAQRSRQRDLLEDLIAGAFKSKELALSRAEALNISLNKPQVIIIVDVDNFAGYIKMPSADNEESAALLKNKLAAIANNRVRQVDWRALVVQRSDSVVVVMPAPLRDSSRNGTADSQTALRTLAENIQKDIGEQHPDITVSIGISSPVDNPLDIAPKYREARDIIKLTRKLQGEGKIAFWEDVEIYSLLERLGEPMERFYAAKLGKLDRPGVKNREELIHTLKVFLECQGNTVETAAKLFIHRNTLRYRLQRIEKLLGQKIGRPDERFSLWLALKIRSFLQVKQ